MEYPEIPPAWSEANSQQFIDYGCYFVPAREQQIELLCNLVPPADGTMQLLELCCGEGVLAEALLEKETLESRDIEEMIAALRHGGRPAEPLSVDVYDDKERKRVQVRIG